MAVVDGIISEGSQNQVQVPAGATIIDGSGMTLIAGYIDNHRHLIGARGQQAVARFLEEEAATQMLDLLEAGVTTVQSGGDDNDGILELKRLIDSGDKGTSYHHILSGSHCRHGK